MQWVKKLADRYLELGGVSKPPVSTSLISLIDGHRIEVRSLPLKACHSAIWRLKNGWIIHLNASEPSAMVVYSQN